MLLKKCISCGRYTISDNCPSCHEVSVSAHPAKFTPDDKFSEQRVRTKRNFGLLPPPTAPLVGKL